MDLTEQYEELTKNLKESVPFNAFPIRVLVRELRQQGDSITLKTELTVKDVYNSGDISGILCVTEHKGGDPIVCGLTHLKVSIKHPLYKEISVYQKKRNRRIQLLNNMN